MILVWIRLKTGQKLLLFDFPLKLFYYVLLRFTTFYYVLLRFTMFYYVLQRFTTFYYVLLRFTTFCYVILRFTALKLRYTTLYHILLHFASFNYGLLHFINQSSLYISKTMFLCRAVVSKAYIFIRTCTIIL